MKKIILSLCLSLSMLHTSMHAEIKYKNYKTAWACFKLAFGSTMAIGNGIGLPVGAVAIVASPKNAGSLLVSMGISYPLTVAGAMIARSGFKDLSRLCAQEMKEEDELEKYQQQQGYLTNR